jgi:hypothetical protein
MMKKRIFILTFIFSFLVSTTGLPMTYHICHLLGKTSISTCDICNVDSGSKDPDCCSNDHPDSNAKISFAKSECCQTEFVYNKVNDEFIFNKTDKINFTFSLLVPYLSTDIIPSNNVFQKTNLISDTSPPFLIDSSIYLSNSILLI